MVLGGLKNSLEKIKHGLVMISIWYGNGVEMAKKRF